MGKPIGSQIHQTSNCLDSYIEFYLSKFANVKGTPMENFTLRFAYEHFDRQVFYAQDLMKLTILSKATTSQTLNSLQKKGLIEMKTQSGDKRKKMIIITDKGVDEVLNLQNAFNEISKVIERNLSIDDKNKLESLLSIIRDNVNKAKNEVSEVKI